jgi:sulfinoalanine decarboxylase/sulfinoalanine decarboxylase/aspartate 1-decarboxylase
LPNADLLSQTLQIARDLVAAEEREPVAPYVPPEELEERLDLSLGQPTDETHLLELMRQVADATPRTGSTRFFNQLFGGRDEVATAADMLTSVLNSSMYTYKIAGPHALIEREVARHMAARLGWRDGEGIFTPGGSMSNLTALIVARNEASPGVRETGESGQLTVYTSRDCHYSIAKGAGIIGLGRDNVRRIPVDDRGRMRCDALRQAIRADRAAGARPAMINATAGTTVLGAFDPLRELAALAREEGVWLHVDGALGASVILSERHGGLLDGIEEADSLTWNAHKLLGVPLICSAILVRRPGLLHRHFNQSASYLFQSDEDELNFGTRALQCGRRNDAFKLWAAWKHHGDAGYGSRIDALFERARYAAEVVERSDSLVLTREPESVNVCFEVRGVPSQDVCEALRQQNRVLVGYGVVEGRRVIRLACVNPAVALADIDAFFDEVLETGERLRSGALTIA